MSLERQKGEFKIETVGVTTTKQTQMKEEMDHSPCPLCQSERFTTLCVEWGSLGVVRCLDCELIYIRPRMKEPEKMYWNPKEYYLKETKLIFEGKAASHRDPNYRHDLRLIERYKKRGNFLDVGCHMGMFLRNARGRGWKLFGVEPSPSLSEIAREKFGIQVFNGFLKDADFPDGFFDVITLTDVFEHMRDPLGELGYVKRMIQKDGLLFIKVPNGSFNLLKLVWYRRLLHRFRFPHDVFRDIFDSREHVVHYTQSTITKMLHRAGFKTIDFRVAPPVQIPSWRSLVGEYYQYPTPWFVDWKVRSARSLLYLGALAQFYLTGRRITPLAPNFIVLAVLEK